VRSKKLNRQPGEICFPGGYIEDGETPLEAALRETTEELLIPRESISVTAPLDVLISPFCSVIYPFLADLTGYRYTFHEAEVQEVFTVPFDFFLHNEPTVFYNQVAVTPEDPAAQYEFLGVESYPWGKSRYSVLYYRYHNRLIWGMTARFTNNIVKLYREMA